MKKVAENYKNSETFGLSRQILDKILYSVKKTCLVLKFILKFSVWMSP